MANSASKTKGSTSAADFISTTENFPEDAWVSLQVRFQRIIDELETASYMWIPFKISWLLAISRSLYLYAMLYVFLAVGFGFFAWLTLKDRPFQGTLKSMEDSSVAPAMKRIYSLSLSISCTGHCKVGCCGRTRCGIHWHHCAWVRDCGVFQLWTRGSIWCI